jgi:hypothetical protein
MDDDGIQFDGRIRGWALWYLQKNRWRFASMCDYEDLQSEALRVFLAVREKHPEITDPDDFLKFYKVKMHYHTRWLGIACFPNPYNFSKNSAGQCISLTSPSGADALERLGNTVCGVGLDVLTDYLDFLKRTPDDLKDVCAAMLREALGIEDVPAATRRRLDGQQRKEPLNSALARLFGLDRKRDLCGEIEKLLHKEKSMSVEAEILVKAKMKRKGEETEQQFLKRLIKKLDALDEDAYFELSEEARTWHDRAIVAYREGQKLPAVPKGEGTVMAATTSPNDDDDVDDDDVNIEEDDEEESQDEDDEEEEAAQPKARAKAAKKPKVAADGTATTGKRGRRPKTNLTDDMVIRVLADKNPRRAGSKSHKIFEHYRDGLTVGEFRAQVMQEGLAKNGFGYLKGDLDSGYIAIEGTRSANV